MASHIQQLRTRTVTAGCQLVAFVFIDFIPPTEEPHLAAADPGELLKS